MSHTEANWHDANQRYLMAAVDEVRAASETFLAPSGITKPGNRTNGDTRCSPEEIAASMDAPPALANLCRAFGLSAFERKLLLMCAGMELDSRFAALYSAAQREGRDWHPNFSLALAIFPDGHWSAISPSRPLRFWHLLNLSAEGSLTTGALRIEERVLHYLTGIHCLDERLAVLVRPLPASPQLVPSHRATAQQIADLWSRRRGTSAIPLVELCGGERQGKKDIAASVCASLGLKLYILPARNLPRTPVEIDTFVRLWEREAILSSSALLIDCDDCGAPESLEDSVLAVAEAISGPLFLSNRGILRCPQRAVVLFEVGKPTRQEQSEIWSNVLKRVPSGTNGTLQSLIAQFSLDSNTIHSVADQALQGLPEQQDVASRVWDTCRIQSRPRLEGLAQRIEPAAAWDDLVLPARQKQILKQIAIHVRSQERVYHVWGFASKGSRGLGISALFAGPSGTGKTMAAEVLANVLRLDLYRIDLSQVVSKYIGETEKNLRRVFDAAEAGAAVLLFDEADALFGKRSEVKDSHDRYANIEVSYLLQRMEAYRGLAILTTNRRSALDPAFFRRIRFVVEFPFPDAAQRAEIWRRIFPAQTPTEGLRVDRLAKLNAAGGHIRNIAMGAAFLACDAGEPVRMSHLLTAARSEFAKFEQPLTEAEVAGWV